eukprot:6885231-Karenia_brevis.AAC.1
MRGRPAGQLGFLDLRGEVEEYKMVNSDIKVMEVQRVKQMSKWMVRMAKWMFQMEMVQRATWTLQRIR